MSSPHPLHSTAEALAAIAERLTYIERMLERLLDSLSEEPDVPAQRDLPRDLQGDLLPRERDQDMPL